MITACGYYCWYNTDYTSLGKNEYTVNPTHTRTHKLIKYNVVSDIDEGIGDLNFSLENYLKTNGKYYALAAF